MTAVLTATDIAFEAGKRPIVDGVSLALEAGRTTIVIGPNGAGKSSLLRLLTGEQTPHRGTVTIEGVPLAAVPAWRLACLRAVLPQTIRLVLPFTVRETANLGLDGIGRKLDRATRERIVAESLDAADVTHLADRTVLTLSGGEQQRVHFARVLCQLAAGQSVASRQVLFLDEPIASLDLSHQLALLDALAGLADRGIAVLAIIHDLNLAAAYADDLVVIDQGRLIARGSPEAVLTDELLASVFRVHARVGEVPCDGRPFVLPRRRR